ncbi:MAG: VWA domain-containing protein [Rhodobacteraceae bacterium]|nr:VWA domain-containing protein [Paracoccaceae bacterium]
MAGPLPLPAEGRLADNLAHFARALRRAGLPIGSGRLVEAVRAVLAAGFTAREDFYWTLHACFVSRPEHREVFAQVFRLFWRDPRYLEHMMAALLPSLRGVQEERRAEAAARRAAEALLDGAARDPPAVPGETGADEPEIAIDATATASAEERLRTLDFEQMGTAEIAAARRAVAALELPVPMLPTRRQGPDPRGPRIDRRATLRALLRRGGEIAALARARPRRRWPNLVVLCDISGSMAQYSRVLLHFVHAVASRRGPGWARVHAFTFGTRLTNVTRHLAARDVDRALAAAGAEARDWQGGTRIGDCLHAFNRDWSRRVMGQGAVVLLISDGLDRGDPALLGAAMQRLALSSRRLIWINPLLRWEGFVPRAAGIRAMLPHVDAFRPGHSIASIAALAEALGRREDGGARARAMRAMAGAWADRPPI